MSILYDEIFQQPEALAHALRENQAAIQTLVAEIKRRDVRFVVLAARGTSDNAATYVKYLWQIVCGLPVALAAPSVHTLYEAQVSFRDALVVGVSQSGAGEDVNEVLVQAKKSGALTLAITNTEDSALAQIADHVLLCRAGVERAVAATKTYTTTLALLASVAAQWTGHNDLMENLTRIEEAASRALKAEEQARQIARTLMHAERMLTVARGLHLCTAIESALKIAETSGTATQAFSSADLLHGPIGSVSARTPCLLFLPHGKTSAMMGEVVEKLTARGARVIIAREEGEPGEDVLPLADTGTELLAPLVDIIPAQLLAYHLTVARNLDPDNPRGLTKVTVTR